MSTPKGQQIEFDVFPKENKANYAYLANIKPEANGTTAPINIIFSHQSIIIIFICVLMLLVASFTLGVEKGKLMAKNTVVPEAAAPIVTSSIMMTATPAVSMAPKTATLAAGPAATITANPPAAAAEAPTAMAKNEAVTSVTSGAYTIQVATVKTETSAKRLADHLTKKGWPSFTRSSGEYIVVLAGNFAKKEEAQAKVKELKKTYSDCFVKKI